jgi:ribosomal protein S18 acetylase RimI-like enzyme
LTSISFAPATTADLETVFSMMRALYEYDRLDFEESRLRRALLGLLQDGRLGRVFLIRDGEAVAGYVALTFQYGLEAGGREIFIDELFIKEPHRGRGLGRDALKFLDELARFEGAVALHLAVEIHNTKAQGFYLAAGFGEPRRYLMSRSVPSPRYADRGRGSTSVCPPASPAAWPESTG